MTSGGILVCGLAALATAMPNTSNGADATVIGVASSPYPTITNLSIVWEIEGDDNANGVVSMHYREQGTTTWHEAMPLYRVPAGENAGFAWANKHAGSILDLKPDTGYEIALELVDPDGGSASSALTAHTRAVPKAPANASVVHVSPTTWVELRKSATPGTIFLLEEGHYKGFELKTSGTAELPIVIRSETPRGAVVDGDIKLDELAYVFVEGLTVNGAISFADTTGMVIRGCLVNADYGSHHAALRAIGNTGATNAYIADNVVLGPTPWEEGVLGADAKGPYLREGIQFTGPGNVIEHNHVKGFYDCISTMEGGGLAVNQTSIDILDNDLDVCTDDAIEADFSMGNVRVMRNRIINSETGLSSQPGLGGPTYFIRNVMYNIIYSPFKLLRGSIGDVLLHNTVVKCGDGFRLPPEPVYRTYSRNNLILGGAGGNVLYGGYTNGEGRPIYLADAQPGVDFDYDGYGAIGMESFYGLLVQPFTSLETMRSNTTEQHAVQVDMSVFASTVEFPVIPFPARMQPDLRLSGTGGAVDVGLPIANVNEDCAGSGPDVGAYEAGAPLPHYGPRALEP